MGEDRKCERCWGSGRIVQASSHGARMNACPNCGGSGIEASGERTERDEQESGKDAEARTVARRRACGWSQRDETGLDVLMVVPAESLAPEQRPCGVCGGPVEQLEGGAWVCVRRCAIPAPAVPEEGERWRVLRDDEDLGPGCYEVGIEGYGPPPGDAILVPASRAEAAERHLAELREEVERVRDFCEDDRVLSMNTMGEKSGAAIAYGIVIERLDAALHPQDSTERTEHG
jgi:hypothetical protein